MRIAVALSGCLTALVFLPALSQGQTMGAYQSSLDGQTYEVRQRGPMGLDVYNSDGAIVAVMDKKKADGNFKGKTQRLATRCPENSGKIEAVEVAPDRIRMRMEVASKSLGGQMVCNMLIGSAWQGFDLVKQTGGAAQGNAAEQPTASSTGSPAQSSTVVERDGLRVELESCQREAPRIVCHFGVTNATGIDKQESIFIHSWTGAWANGDVHAAGPSAYIDQLGNNVQASSVQLGNQNGGALLVPGLRMPTQLVFDNADSRATQLVRLQLNFWDGGRGTVTQFTNISVVDPDLAQNTLSNGDSSGGSRILTRSSVRYELRQCRREGGNLVCNLYVTSLNSASYKISWFPQQTYFIDELGNRVQASELRIGQKPLQGEAPLSPNLRVPLVINFAGLDANATELARLELAGNDGAAVTVRYSGIPIEAGK